MTAIEWTDRTWNPTTGCSKVSPGCAHCYAETLSLRFGWSKKPWTPENAAENVVLHPERLDKPLTWRKPSMVFVNSMSDLFHELIPDGYIAKVFAVMALASQHTFQVLTKRPERAREWARWAADGRIADAISDLGYDERFPGEYDWTTSPLPNVWIGTSIENMRHVGRADTLREIPAAVRFISAEPLLGPLLERIYCPECWDWQNGHCSGCDGMRWWYSTESLDLTDIDWLIVGGESGPTHRPIKPEWVRELRDASEIIGAAFFFKQWGGRTPKSNGRLLDGREWSEYPRVRSEAEAR